MQKGRKHGSVNGHSLDGFNPEEQTEREILDLISQEIEFKLNKEHNTSNFLKDTFSS